MSIMFMKIRAFLVGFIASEEGVQKQAILPVAWVAAVLMAGAVVLNMPDKAQASTYCWAAWCPNTSPAVNCNTACQSNCFPKNWGTCLNYGSSGQKRCRCQDSS